jgi:hypothetical protein
MIKCNYGRSFKTENIEAVWENKEIENKILTLLHEKTVKN